MKIWIMSDIHLELSRDWDLPPPNWRPDFDVLVVAGDLCPRTERGVAWLRERVEGKRVVYISGNHESYNADIDVTLQKARAAAQSTNIHVLQNDAVEIDGVLFVGTTLWTDFNLFGNTTVAMNAAQTGMNDFKRIRKQNYGYRLRPTDTLARHLESRRFIESELTKAFHGKRVVVTHHAPLRECAARGHEEDIISAAYVSDLSDVIERYQPDLWLYGHVHESRDLTVGKTRVVSNTKGYGVIPENESFDPRLVIEI